MSVDLVIKQGNTVPVFSQVILDAYGNPLDITGASVNFVMRTLTGNVPTTDAAATIVNPAVGTVSYTFTADDTATPGLYMGEFEVTLEGGGTYTYPNDGYLSISVEESLTAANGTELVTVADAKDQLRIDSSDHSEDAKILRFIRSCRAPIEAITGPIIPDTFEEWHDGGNPWITVNHRPSTALGTSPVFSILAISEYNGPIEWPLAIISSPDEGDLYSAQADVQRGRIVRRTAGGGVQAFPAMPQSVHVFYEAGQRAVPDNVYDATLELIRIHYQRSQEQTSLRLGSGGFGEGDEDEPKTPPIGFFLPQGIHERLAPNRRFPSLA